MALQGEDSEIICVTLNDCVKEAVKMVVEDKSVNYIESLAKDFDDKKMAVGNNLRTVLRKAQSESRVVVGLSEAVKNLSELPEEALFCVLAPPKKGDSATHMHEVLLQAFCFENDIYIIQVRVSYVSQYYLYPELLYHS